MASKKVSDGVVHTTPADLREKLIADSNAFKKWEAITPLSRNEWLCWTESAKKSETRAARIERILNDIKIGKNRPCCWPGCPHRAKTGAAKQKKNQDLYCDLSSS